jgi:hypothetical protein
LGGGALIIPAPATKKVGTATSLTLEIDNDVDEMTRAFDGR